MFPDEPTFSRSKKSPWAVEVDGFSVEAGVHFGALDRKGRERLLRYLLRPPIATERFSILRDGSVAYRTKYGRGSKTHRIMQPMEAMARIAALVPPPRRPLLRYHGVLAPGSPFRSRVAALRDRANASEYALATQMRATPRLKHLRRKPDRGDLARRTSHGPS
jgi:hypothetical protein